MQNFQQILTQAAQLKQHQLKKQRKTYQSLPQFIKSGLGYTKKYKFLRRQHFLYQYRVSNRIKQQGNSLFKENKWQQALTKYEQALGVFRYISSKNYENMKDTDLQYCQYDSSSLAHQLKSKYQSHLCALYLNICSCLTKLNKKQDAIYSADQALKIKKTVKAHYKKAQIYLKYVNRDTNDIKLGILQLKQAYSIQKNPQIIRQMHMAKQSYQGEQQKSKNWFKFMFDKNKNTQDRLEQSRQKSNSQSKIQQKIKEQQKKQKVSEEMLQIQKIAKKSDESVKFQQTKQKLKIYLNMSQQIWQQNYQKDFIKRHGSKIYSILKIYKHQQLVSQWRALLASNLEKQQNPQKTYKNCKQCILWLRMHPVDKISKYIQRYDLQTNWIKQNRQQSKNEKKQSYKQNPALNTNSQQTQVQELQQKQKIFNKKKEQQQQTNSSTPKIEETQKQNRVLEQREKKRMKRQKNQKYITVIIVLLLLLIRFLWS